MHPDWKHLQNNTMAVQLSFLDAELKTGFTFARLASTANDPDKISRNLMNARKAHDAITGYLGNFPQQTPETEGIRQKLRALHEMIQTLEK
jgi:hypothetical protein